MTAYCFRALRYVHDVSTEEFVNIGIAMWVPEKRGFIFKINTRYKRITRFFKDFDGKSYRMAIRNLNRAFKGAQRDLRTQELPDNVADIFHCALREDNSSFQWSRVMSGVSPEPARRLVILFEEFVAQHE